MPKSMSKLDASDAIFFQRELESVIARVWEARRPAFSAFEFIPITSETDPGDKVFVWYEMDAIGEAKIIAAGSNDLPMIDIFMRENVGQVRQVGEKFSYSTDDIRAAAKAGKPLTTMKASAAMKASDRKINKIAWFGDAPSQLPGIMTARNVTRVTPASAAASPNGTGWNAASGKTGDEIITDLNEFIESAYRATNGVEVIDTVLISSDEFSYLSVTRLDLYNPMTLITHIRAIHPGVTFAPVPELNDVPAADLPVAAAAAANMAFAYRRADDVIRLEIPLPFTQLPPQPKDLVWNVPCEAKTAGVTIHLPLACATMQGI